MGELAARKFRFDEDYYQRFYPDSEAPEAAPTRLGDFLGSYLDHMGVDVRRVLDMGCGVGNWRPVIARAYPRATYTGVEYSRYLCQKLGWVQGSAVDYSASRKFDLVICQSVLQYLDARQARKAIGNLAGLCRGALYLEALTVKDWEENCDRRHTDGEVYLRQGAWYRRELARHFVNCGGGVFLSKGSPVVMYELETAE